MHKYNKNVLYILQSNMFSILMLMIACSGIWPLVNTKAVPLQATINLFINWLLGLTLTPGLTRPLWDLLDHCGFY